MSLAQDIVNLQGREWQRQSNFRSMWQSVSDLMFPQTYGIQTYRTPGQDLMTNIFDTTAIEEAENMTSGLMNNLFPVGNRFFAWVPLAGTAAETRYLEYLTEQTHEFIYDSNFMAQVTNTIHYWLTFGTGALYTEYDLVDGLNYRDYAIGSYQCLENSKGNINTIILETEMTAAQIFERWGDNSGKSVIHSMRNPESHGDKYKVIQVIRPRKLRNERILTSQNKAFQSVFVLKEDVHLLEEGGFDSFPFSIPRYQVIYQEVYGRGRGTMMLPTVRILNRLAKDYLEMSNKWVRPPLEILDGFNGTVDLTPAGENYVPEKGTITPIPMATHGTYPVGVDTLEDYRERVRLGFFKNAFEAITPLSGDRRTTTEIVERLKEGMKKLSKPLNRLFIELLAPVVQRTTMLLISNRVIEPPPGPIQAKLDFISPLALAIRDQQARSFEYWVASVLGMSEAFPEALDNISVDQGVRDMGSSMGVKHTHIRPIEEVEQIREQRAIESARKQEMMMEAGAAEMYQKMTKAPEEGSPVAGGA